MAVCTVFDSSVLQHQPNIPEAFIWPDEERPSPDAPELPIPLIDIGKFLSGASMEACKLVREACEKHGVFLVVNHGVDQLLINEVYRFLDDFFERPLLEKMKAERKPGESYGYSSSFVGRYTTKLPWKETITFQYLDKVEQPNLVQEHFMKFMDGNFQQYGKAYQEYCNKMSSLSFGILKLLAVSLGVDPAHFKDFFQGHESIMRITYYPMCQQPELTLGTGPHCDPTSITILHQDNVGGLQVFFDNKWHSISPNSKAFVINIGETFTALSNGKYKSCEHRVVVNKETSRKSLAFFLSPENHKLVVPPRELVNSTRVYSDFTWATFREFTNKHYRADTNTLKAFNQWLRSSNKSS